MSESWSKGLGVLEEVFRLSQITKLPCNAFKHTVIPNWVGGNVPVTEVFIDFEVPTEACWIVTMVGIRSIPEVVAPMDGGDFASDESLNPFQERLTPDVDLIGWLWWEVNGTPVNATTDNFIAMTGGQTLWVFKAGQKVRLLGQAPNSVGGEVYWLVRINSYLAPAEAAQVLAPLQTQIVQSIPLPP